MNKKEYWDKYYAENKEELSYRRAHTINGKYVAYKSKSKYRGLVFELTYDEFSYIVSQLCTYCGGYNNPNGIDRVDNSIGYISGNCVPCCYRCNVMRNRLSQEEFKTHIIKLYNNFGIGLDED